MVEHQRVVIMKVQLGTRCRRGAGWRPLGAGTSQSEPKATTSSHHHLLLSHLYRPFRDLYQSTASCRQAKIASLLNHAALDSSRW